ncbi:3-oxoacyl-ACP synthase III family protein [Micromonospora sp. DT41]|uniref:3-oxoacyl-ACP synthase III family protein n=1 Tax=Micromonospora sp. DT41 TaxID=3393437 RepID=UPI003CED8858
MQFGIIGTGSYLPPTVVSNDTLVERLDIGADWIVDRTGIRERRRALDSEATSDCATAAAREALAAAGITADDLDFIIVGTSTPDHPQPATAVLVQRDIAAHRAAAFDVNAVCTSFVYSLDVARGLLGADPRTRYALVIGADIYSRQLDYTDRRTCVLFGDGAGAVVLGPVPAGHGMLTSRLVSDGRLHDLVRVPAGGSRLECDENARACGDQYFKMRGRDVRTYVEEVFPALLDELLKDSGLEAGDLDLVVPHQANGVMLDRVATDFGLRPDQLHHTYPRYGNTGAASVPVTLDDAVRGGRLRGSGYVVLIAFGGGMTAGASLHRWAADRHEHAGLRDG